MTATSDVSGFGHVETWVFDLDNTLYPADCDLFSQIDKRMGAFIAEPFGLPLDEAHELRQRYYAEHGTTLAGLVQLSRCLPRQLSRLCARHRSRHGVAGAGAWRLRSTRCRGGSSCSPTARASTLKPWPQSSACSTASRTSSTSTRSNTSTRSRRAKPLTASSRRTALPRRAPPCSTTCRTIWRPRTPSA